MKTLKTLFLFILCVPTLFVNAQSLSNTQERFMKMDVLRLMEDYQMYAVSSNPVYRNQFINLFVDGDAPVFNDLLGMSSFKSLSALQYANILSTEILAPIVFIKNIRHDEPYPAGDNWIMNVYFEKNMEHIDSLEVQFSSLEYYKQDYQMHAQIVWNPSNRQCKFLSIQGSVDGEPLPEHYWVLRHTDARDSLLLFNNEPFTFDRFDQAFFERNVLPENVKLTKKNNPLTTLQNQFNYPVDSDVDLKLVIDTGHIVNTFYKPKRWRVKIHGNISHNFVNTLLCDAVNMAYQELTFNKDLYYGTTSVLEYTSGKFFHAFDKTLSFNQEENLKKTMRNKIDTYSGGFAFGYTFPTENKNKWAFFFGLDYRYLKLTSTVGSLSYLYDDKDMDQDYYYRYYNIKDMEYQTVFNEIAIPLYFDRDIKVNKNTSFYMDFGVKSYFTILQPQKSFKATYSTKGYYPQYNGLIFDGSSFDNYPFNGFVTDRTELTVNNIVSPERNLQDTNTGDPLMDIFNSVRNIDTDVIIDVMFGMGYRSRLYKNLFLEYGLTYQHNVFNTLKKSPSIRIRKNIDYEKDLPGTGNNSGKGQVPIYWDGSKENVKDLFEFYKNFAPHTLSLNLGLMYRF